MSTSAVPGSTEPQEQAGTWTFLTNHAHVLLALHRDPDLRQRDIARLVGITEGAVQRILHELEETNYLSIERIGRRNHYEVRTDVELRHPLDAGHTVGQVLESLRPVTSSDCEESRRHEPPRLHRSNAA